MGTLACKPVAVASVEEAMPIFPLDLVQRLPGLEGELTIIVVLARHRHTGASKNGGEGLGRASHPRNYF